MSEHALTVYAAPTPTRARSRSDRAWAWAGALLAAGVSVAVNIAHAGPHAPSAFEAAELARAGMAVPETVGSWGFAAFAATLPVMVLIAAEQTARRLLGRATLPVMLSIGVCAYSLSFWHTVLLLASWGEPWPLRITGAVAVDGLAVASVIALWYANTPDAEPVAPVAAERPDVRPAAGQEAREPDARTDAARPVPARPDVETSASGPDVRPVVLASNPSGTVRLMADVRTDAPAPDVRPDAPDAPARTLNGAARPPVAPESEPVSPATDESEPVATPRRVSALTTVRPAAATSRTGGASERVRSHLRGHGLVGQPLSREQADEVAAATSASVATVRRVAAGLRPESEASGDDVGAEAARKRAGRRAES